MKKIIFIIMICSFSKLHAQELYVYTEPASNMPSRSISGKLTGHFSFQRNIYAKFPQRYMPELMFGINKKIMVHLGGTIANVHTGKMESESVYLYAKYRFLSWDEVHKHFRMAVFAKAASTKAPFHYEEVSLMGDKSGVEAGIIGTQLWNRFAISATVTHAQVLDKSRNDDVIYLPSRIYQAMDYSLSGGFLVFPKEYTDYKQTNLNIYLEILAQQSLDRSAYYIDVAPAIQLIFNSNSKLNIGYRTQAKGSMQRMSYNSWLVSFERTFLNAWKKRNSN